METLNLKNLKVMVIDDHAPMRHLLMSLLRELGITKFFQASSGLVALQALRNDEPDIIITDSIMDPVNGLEFTRRVRNAETNVDPFVPIIMVSGQTELVNIVEARDAGVTEFLAKPISARSVYARLSKVIAEPRSFIRTEGFFGPDRRRKDLDFGGEDRRAMKGARNVKNTNANNANASAEALHSG